MTTSPLNFDSVDAIPDDSLDNSAIASVSAGADASAAPEPFASQTVAPSIGFGVTEIQPAYQPGVYLTSDDAVQLSAWNSNATLTSVAVQLRILNPDGTITIQALNIPNLTHDRTQNIAVFTTTEGFLVGAVMGPPGAAISRGQCFVTLEVVRGAPPTQLVTEVVIADYLSTAFQPSWPWAQPRSAVDGRGAILTYTANNPMPPNGSTIIQPANALWRIMSATSQYTTSAVAGARNMILFIDPPASQASQFGCDVNQLANLAYNYVWGPSLQLGEADSLLYQGNLPTDYLTPPGTQYQVDATGYQAGDLYGPLSLTVEEWVNV